MRRFDLSAGTWWRSCSGRPRPGRRSAPVFTRATTTAPPNFIDVPIARSITDRATPSARIAPFAVLHAHENDTTHLSKIDAGGSDAALTYTIVEDFGSKSVVASAGFRLNNKKGDCNLIPGRTNTSGRIGTPANLIAPGKRMLSSQAPTVVLPDSCMHLGTGSPGGCAIPSTVLWVVIHVL